MLAGVGPGTISLLEYRMRTQAKTHHLSPKQVAVAFGVSEASIKRWCDDGRIPATRTAGGHRRIDLGDLVRYVRENDYSFVRPEILGLPPSSGEGARQISRLLSHVGAALELGDSDRFRQLIVNAFLGGLTCCEIFDSIIAEVFRELGSQWQHGDIEVYQERRACEICMQTLYELAALLPATPADAPKAVGGTLSGDPYTLATTMAAVALKERGWSASSLGVNLPAGTLCAALRSERPRLLWLSVSHIETEETFRIEYERLFATASEEGTAVAIGGRALHAALRRKLEYSAYCDQLKHLVSFAATLYRG